MEEREIDITDPEKDFADHLKAGNDRIIFSGPFGIGKSTFIEKFFEKQKSNFFRIKLTPIDYSISSNEDIFELVKYDILVNLILCGEIDFDDFGEFTKAEHLSYFIASGFNPFPYLLNQLTRLGDDDLDKIGMVINATQKLTKQWDKLASTHKNLNKNVDAKFISSYLKEFDKNHFILENGFVKSMINRSLRMINADKNKAKRKTVLIIDDLDRIDPEHIFRMFNVFASRLSFERNDPEKIHFDHIIFVCDIANIRSVFHHKYGTNADFDGYTDKFYSTEIFSFNNASAITEWLSGILGNQKLGELTPLEFQMLKNTLLALLNHNIINLRNLKKSYNANYWYTINRNLSKNYLMGFMRVYLILKGIMGSHEHLAQKLEKLSLILDSVDSHIDEELFIHKTPYLYKIIMPIFHPRTSYTFENSSGGRLSYSSYEVQDRRFTQESNPNMFNLSNKYFMHAFLKALNVAKNKS